MRIRNKEWKYPLIQGGMGIGISMGNLAGHVARCGGIGMISSANAGFKEDDYLTNPREANLRGLRKAIQKAKEIAGGKGLVGVNVMTATSNCEEACRCAVESGADVIISGAGLPMKLPEYVAGSDTLFAPIVSSGRAAKLLLRQYRKRYKVEPDFFVIEGHEAGGHLGFDREELDNHTAKDNDTILKEVLEEVGDIPVFVAGGVFTAEDRKHFMDLGASGVQVGTRFIATEECDASQGFKDAIIKAHAEDIVITKSPVGMPARAIFSPLLQRLEEGEPFRAIRCNKCLSACGNKAESLYCISRALIEAAMGNWEKGLFFVGTNAARIKEMTTVEALVKELMQEG